MDIITQPKFAILERAAAFFEQGLLIALEHNELTNSKEVIEALFKECSEKGKSFSTEFNSVVLEDNWREELGVVAEKATERLQAWMVETKIRDQVSSVVQYDRVDEKGRAYRRTPLAATAPPNFFFKVEHIPSRTPLLVPLFGWIHDKEAMEELIEEDRIAYGKKPWDTVYEKNFLG